MSDGAHKVKADIEKKREKIFFGLVKVTFGLVDVGYSLPEGQVVKLIFFAPCYYRRRNPKQLDFLFGLITDFSLTDLRRTH